MREQGKNWVHSLSCFIVFWIVGGIVGAIIAICFEGKYEESYQQMQLWVSETVKGMKQNQMSYFILNFKSHTKELVLLLCMSFTFFSVIYKILFCFWKGIVTGFVCIAAIKMYSINGLLLGGLYIFPHGFFYGIGMIGGFLLSKEIEEKNLYSYGKKDSWFLKKIPGFLFCMVAIGIGAYLEGNINLMLLKKTLENINKPELFTEQFLS